MITRRRGGAAALLAALVVGCAQQPGADGVAAGAEPGPKREEAKVKEHRSGEWTPGLTDQERATLFAIARDTLAWCTAAGSRVFTFDSYRLTPRLKEPAATFVTLKIRGQLRGCIGSLAPADALYRSVHENAVRAARRDSRFQPVRPEELGQITISVSVLSPIRPIASPDEFRLGEHGIILERGRYRAVFLPEVAVEQGWTREETLSHLSLKAGMGADSWREGATFKVFESVVLSE